MPNTTIPKTKDTETASPNLAVIVERRNWLIARIAAKKSVGWDIEWDQRECDAHTWAIETISKDPQYSESSKSL